MVSLSGTGIKGPLLPPPWGWGHGLILRRRPLGEEDLRLDILFIRRGILEGLVRRGALPTTPQTGALDPPAISFFRFQWLSQEKVRIRQWEEARLFPRAREHASLVMEVCHALTSLLPRGWWDPEAFRCAIRVLRDLERGVSPEKALLLFQVGMLEATGHSPWHLLFPQHPSPRPPPSDKTLVKDLKTVVDTLWQELLGARPKRRVRQ